VASAEQAFNASIKRARAMVRLHEKVHGKQGRPPQHVADILRGALVLSIAALDALVSASVAGLLPQLIKTNAIDPALERWIKANPDVVVECLASTDPVQALTQALDEKMLLTSSYQRVERIQAILSDFGDCQVVWTDVAVAATNARVAGRAWTDADVRKRLNAFVERRNAIAHQGDLKSGTIGAMPITRPFVEEAIGLIECTGKHVYAVAKKRKRQLAQTVKHQPKDGGGTVGKP
jgi:hypothetical protein